MTDWHTASEKPASGRKIISVYDDGSGAALFFVHDGGFIDSDGDDRGVALPEGFGRWAYLPDDLEFWCETRREDPVSFTTGERQS